MELIWFPIAQPIKDTFKSHIVQMELFIPGAIERFIFYLNPT